MLDQVLGEVVIGLARDPRLVRVSPQVHRVDCLVPQRGRDLALVVAEPDEGPEDVRRCSDLVGRPGHRVGEPARERQLHDGGRPLHGVAAVLDAERDERLDDHAAVLGAVRQTFDVRGGEEPIGQLVPLLGHRTTVVAAAAPTRRTTGSSGPGEDRGLARRLVGLDFVVAL